MAVRSRQLVADGVRHCHPVFLFPKIVKIPYTFYMQVKNIDLFSLVANSGQIKGLPANPRKFPDLKLEKLMASLKEDPEMLNFRPLLVYPHGKKYVILAGNMRFAAAEKLWINELPCVVVPKDTPIDKLKAILIKDNLNYGEWDWEMLGNDWDIELLADWGLEGMPELDIEDDAPEGDNTVTDPLKLTIKCTGAEEAQNLFHELSNRGFDVEIK